jgi:high-affinity iron transporter
MTTGKLSPSSIPSTQRHETHSLLEGQDPNIRAQEKDEENRVRIAKLIKRMRIQIWAGTIGGFIIALAIGAAFIAVVG